MLTMPKQFVLFAITNFLLLTGCASTYDPVVDMKDVNAAEYRRDLEDCRAYGDKVDMLGDTAVDSIVGAGIGAAIGASVGATRGSDYAGSGAMLGVAAGGSAGGSYGAVNAVKRQKAIIRKCLRGRGYKVLE